MMVPGTLPGPEGTIGSNARNLDADAPARGLIGDDGALPAFETTHESRPAATPALVLAAAADLDEARPRPGSAGSRWLLRATGATDAGQFRRAAHCGLAAPPAGARAHVATEAAAMRRIRQCLAEEPGIPRSHVTARGYWKLGAVNLLHHEDGDDA